jgi:hypothetical protein
MLSKSKAISTIDTRFVPEVRPTTKAAYVSVEELTKSWISFNPNPLQMITKI